MPISWTSIKDIYKLIVKLFGTPVQGPEILDAPDGPGPWWHKAKPDGGWCLRVMQGELTEEQRRHLHTLGGRWIKIIPPGPAPASEDGQWERLQAAIDAARAVVDYCKGWGHATGSFTELGLKIHSMSLALAALEESAASE